MYKALSALLIATLSSLLGATSAQAQATFWSENFNNGCSSNCVASTYNGWSILDNMEGTTGSAPNNWFVSCAEEGVAPPGCGSSCVGDASLHIGSDPGSGGDMGASANDTGATNATFRMAVSPTISTVGNSGDGLYLEFDYIAFGSSACTDDAAFLRLSADNGATWPAAYQQCLNTLCCGACNGYSQGQWTRFRMALPAAFQDNPNVRIGFQWRNNGNGSITDPPVAVDDIALINGTNDTDGDTILNVNDNCPTVPNTAQTNSDGDTPGDACDNCPLVTNQDQANNDGDSEGDLCDADDDNDTVPDTGDNCPLIVNTDQANNDGDALGDLCDPDDDNDGIFDAGDNCPLIGNTDQANNDGDALGDVCDPDDDDDTVPDITDNCPLIVNTDQADNDADTLGDLCDPDDDNDGVLDTGDNCPLIGNTDQANNDADALGDLCDPDDDNDGILDTGDNCPLVGNTDQANNDADALGDVCDPDDDNDGVLDNNDNCPLIVNADQADNDGDDAGNVCDLCPDDPLDLCPAVIDVFENGYESP